MKTYKHTQRGKLIIIVMSVMSVVMTVIGLTATKYTLFAIPILVISGWLFHSLTIEISADELRWAFGPGLIQKRVPITEIASINPVRTNLIEGWGIHWSRYGWLYNVSGYDAIAVTLRDGKRFALGTDEPEILASTLKQALIDALSANY